MRIGLAVAIVLYHTVLTSDGAYWDMRYWTGDLRGLLSSLLPIFFALSGFIVAGSLERTPKLSQFLTLRVIRLAPALGVEILLCALILGPLVKALQRRVAQPAAKAFRALVPARPAKTPGRTRQA
jgi:peptidoglycan/LPS O-acetylase OafA/YrhL